MKVTIVGIGLLGGSLALAIRQLYPQLQVFGVDIDPVNASRALSLKIVDQITSLEEAVPQSDLVVLATPVDVIVRLIGPVLDLLSEKGTVIDLGSTKYQVCQAAALHPKRKQFVAVHPMAGTENSGAEAAFKELLPGKVLVICDQQNSRPQAVGLVKRIFEDIGMELDYMDSLEHDRHLAYVSHLSHLSSFALGLTVLEIEKDEKAIFELASTGFSSTVRLAKSSPRMWAPIFEQNKQNVLAALDSYIKNLETFRKIIEKDDAQASYDLMNRANEIRRVLLGIDKRSWKKEDGQGKL